MNNRSIIIGIQQYTGFVKRINQAYVKIPAQPFCQFLCNSIGIGI